MKTDKRFEKILSEALDSRLGVGPRDRARLTAALGRTGAVRGQKNFASPALRFGAGLALAAASLLVVFLVLPTGRFILDPAAGRVTVISGNRDTILSEKTVIASRAEVVTPENSGCWLKYGRNVVYLAPRSSLRLSPVRWTFAGPSAMLRLESGRLDINFRDRVALKRLAVKTPNADVSVRGTIFSVSLPRNDRTSVSVLSGKVLVSSESGCAYVTAGRSVSVDGSTAPAEGRPVNPVLFAKALDFMANHEVLRSIPAAGLDGIRTAADLKHLYFVSEDGTVFALERKTLRTSWRANVPANVTAAPACADGRLYICSSDGTLTCLLNGRTLWRKNLGPSVYSSPVFAAGRLCVADTAGTVALLDASNGALVWSTALKEAVFSTPCVEGRSVYITTLNAGIVKLDLLTGKQLWTTRLEGRMLDAPPVCVDGRIYAASSAGLLYRIDGRTGAVQSSMKLRAGADGPMVRLGDSLFIRSAGLESVRLSKELSRPTLIVPGSRKTGFVFANGLIFSDSGNVLVAGTDGTVRERYYKSSGLRLLSVDGRLFAYDGKYLKGME